MLYVQLLLKILVCNYFIITYKCYKNFDLVIVSLMLQLSKQAKNNITTVFFPMITQSLSQTRTSRYFIN